MCTVEVVRAASGGAALVCVDAVHLAPHRALDVRTLGCDILACSAYKGHSLMTLQVFVRLVTMSQLDLHSLEKEK